MSLEKSDKTKTVLITGCSSGIGRVAAIELQRAGFNVFASVRKAADVQSLQALGLNALQLDLDCGQSIKSALAQVLEQTDGKLYGLFNNGGFGQAGAVEDLPTEALREQFETLVFGWHELTRQVIPIMRRQGEGRIVQNSSVLGFAAMPYRGAYNAAKFAIEGLTDTLRLELRNTNIYVSIIQPGPIQSRFRANGIAKFNQHIDAQNSVHKQQYQLTIDRLAAPESGNRFVLAPEAVVEKLLHALQSNSPKIRYRVTTPTIAFALLKRLLPNQMLDTILSRVT